MIYTPPVRDMLFLVDEWISLDNIRKLPGHEDLDREMLEAILEEAGKFGVNELLPLNLEGDEVGAVLVDGEVRTPPGFRKAYERFVEAGWTGIDADPAHGGQGLPKLVQYLIDEMLAACNLSFMLYPDLTHGAYHLINAFASDELRERYLPKMAEGVWSGTMCLTEPHSGTDLGLLTTKAVPRGDGAYDITGSKIFITSGDHDLTENIIHMVLARIEDAPEGVRGISLFLVPKSIVNDDGSVGERNNVLTGSLEHKMGIRASATCALNFDGATGFLVGAENRGLNAMFRMMNMERIAVGIQGLGIAEIAYQNALVYARERLQSRAPGKRPDENRAADPIIYQPDIQRKLLRIRSQVEGARALAVYSGHLVDVFDKTVDDDHRVQAAGLIALLTPMVKSFLSDLGVESALAAQQVFGGHGYVTEHGMEQLVRDARIAQIYEGTNEVQAVDLVTRKLTADKGGVVEGQFEYWGGFFERNDDPAEILKPASAALEQLKTATRWIRDSLESDPARALGAATEYQRLFGLTIIGCIWADIVVSIAGKDGEFYGRKRKLARFYMEHVLPEAASLTEVITGGSDALAEFSVEDFVGN
ncbi:MAG TPA: acyl-CoA dehydrogenase family protein [Gammaproteobacteria bacterium]